MEDGKQERLERLMVDLKPMDRLGHFVDPAWAGRRVEVVERGVHGRTRVEYFRVRVGGSGGGWWYRASEVRLLHPDDV